jgi:tryptophan 2,3-dioxygenase
MSTSTITDQISEKYISLGENPETYLKGLLHAKPINYWDYIEVDTLLSLQKPRTNFKDEEIFIMYHQVTELFLKLTLHEIKQVSEEPIYTEKFLLNKFTRIIRYTQMLVNSFDIMKYGMDYDDYNTFRATLAPASGFQSAQFRYIEIYCTGLENLINEAGKERLKTLENPSITDYFKHIYWKDAGLNRKTGAKTLTLTLFEEKYLNQFIGLATSLKGKTIADRLNELNDKSETLISLLKEFDNLYNVVWPMVHLSTAKHYLDSKNENQQATGGSEWKKYLHPQFQQRKFFPNLWSVNEKENWGIEK